MPVRLINADDLRPLDGLRMKELDFLCVSPKNKNPQKAIEQRKRRIERLRRYLEETGRKETI